MDEEASTEADVARAARALALPSPALEFKCTDGYVTEAAADRPGRPGPPA